MCVMSGGTANLDDGLVTSAHRWSWARIRLTGIITARLDRNGTLRWLRSADARLRRRVVSDQPLGTRAFSKLRVMRFSDLSDRSDLSNNCVENGLMTREDRKITFPKFRVCACAARSPFPPFESAAHPAPPGVTDDYENNQKIKKNLDRGIEKNVFQAILPRIF